jgi:hypothetical protein
MPYAMPSTRGCMNVEDDFNAKSQRRKVKILSNNSRVKRCKQVFTVYEVTMSSFFFASFASLR